MNHGEDGNGDCETRIVFGTDAREAIGNSITSGKLLMLYVEDPSESFKSSESSEQIDWIKHVLQENPIVTQETKAIIRDAFVTLKISKGSDDYENFLSVIPSFANVLTPCILFIFSGQIIDLLPKDIDTTTVNARVQNLVTKLRGIHPPNQPQTTNQERGQNEVPSTPQSTASAPHIPAQTSSPTPTGVQATLAPSTPHADSSSNSTLKTSAAVKKQEQKSLKEESAEIAAQIYRENLLKKQRQAKMDRERILHLMEQDRRELKNRNLERIRSQEGQSDATPNIDTKSSIPHENLHNARLQNSDIYTIQLKLFDGSTTRHKFKSLDKLSTIRDFVLSQYPDYNSQPFYFFKNVDRVTFGDADENKSLLLLNLNMSTLILKPIEPEENLKVAHAKDPTPSTFSWLKNRMHSYLWPGQHTSVHESSSSPLAHTSDTLSSSSASNASSGYVEERLRQRNHGEEESDTDSMYHTPILRSSTPSTTSIRPIMSSFNLYGSQGLLNISSALPSTSNIPQLAEDQQNTGMVPETSNINTVGTTCSSALNSSVSLPDDAATTRANPTRATYTVQNVDETIRVNNGNSISLEYPDDDEK